MMKLLQTPLFKIGAVAMAAAIAGVAALFVCALHAPALPEPTAWRATLIAADANAPIRVSDASDAR
jgi:hypothetical protein